MNYKDRLGIRGKFLIVHSGNMGVKQGLRVILDAAHLSREDKSLHYLIVGDGAVREKLQDQAKEMRLDNLQLLPLLSDEEFKELLAATDVSLITQQKCVADIVFPSKVITLMASARAIVASVSPTSEVARVLNVAEAGLVAPAEDHVSLLAAVTTLRDDDSLRQKIAFNAREFARRNWDRNVILAGMESSLYTLLASGAVKGTNNRQIWRLTRSKQKRTAVSQNDRAEAATPTSVGR